MRSFAIVPAAGQSRRMGRAKLLLPWRDSTVIESVLAAWRASQVERVVVTVGPTDDELATRCSACGAEVVRAASAPPQMKDSVLLALEHIRATAAPSDTDAWLLAPADGVGLTARAINLVIDEFVSCAAASGTAKIVVPCVGGRRGHPVAFPWRLATEVGRLGADEGINVLRKRHAAHQWDIAEALGDEAEQILIDLDTPQDYRRLRQQYGSR
jgi:molybdenum cofactor cytidylyltransferase